MRVDLHPALLLHRRAYRETSLLLEVFSYVHGRVGLVARGALRPASRLGAILQPFCSLQLAWVGRGELGTLTDAEAQGKPLLQEGGLLAGFYLNELLMRLIERHDPHPDLYVDYRDALSSLGRGEAEAAVLRRFEKRLLKATGYEPVLDRDVVSGEAIVAAQTYAYRPEQGPSRLWPDAQPSEIAVPGRVLLALASEELFDPQVLRDAKRLMRALLAPHLGERPIVSRSWHLDE